MINYEQAAIQQPKIDIIGKEVPLAALDKVGNQLQDRYDKSYEQYSLADEALKQMEASANPIDREKAKELRGVYSNEMKGIVDAGDFHNMRHQTAALARNAAMNYKTIAERNAEIQKGVAAINADPRYFRDKDKRVIDYLAKQKSIGFDPDARTITGANVNPWTGVANVNDEKLGLSYGTVMKPITIGGETGVIKYKDANGNLSDSPSAGGTAWHMVNGKVTKELKPAEIASAVGQALRNDPELNADINQDLNHEFESGKYKGIDPNSPEGQAIRQQHIDARISKAANSAGNLLRQHERQTSSDETIAAGSENLGLAIGDSAGGKYTPVTLNNPLEGEAKREFSTDLANSFTGDPKSVYNTRNIVSSLAEQYRAKGDEKTAAKYEKYLGDITTVQNLTQKYPNLMEYMKPSRTDNTGMVSLKEAVRSGLVNLDPQDKAVVNKLSTDIGTSGKTNMEMQSWFDRQLDDDYENFKQPGVRNIGMMQPDLVDDATRNKIESLSKGLDINAFNLPKDVKDNWGENQRIEIESWSAEPMGNGVGILFGIKNPKTGEVHYATPKNRRSDGLVQQVSKYLYQPAAAYDALSNLPSPTRKTKVSSLLKTAELPKEMTTLSPTDEVNFKDGRYYVEGNPAESYGSIYELFYSKLRK